MNYRHGYHAGNFADVLKHTALSELLHLLLSKDKKLFVLDTNVLISAALTRGGTCDLLFQSLADGQFAAAWRLVGPPPPARGPVNQWG